MTYIFNKFTSCATVLIAITFFSGCASKPVSNPDTNAVITDKSDIDVLRKHIAQISENGTFPVIVEPLRKSMHNPDRFEFIRAESALRERSIKRPSGTHITYYYLIRIHFRGENAFGALRLSHQDYHLYPTGKIQAIQKRKN